MERLIAKQLTGDEKWRRVQRRRRRIPAALFVQSATDEVYFEVGLTGGNPAHKYANAYISDTLAAASNNSMPKPNTG